MSDNLNFVKIEKFKNSININNNHCLKFLFKQCVSFDDIILTVHSQSFHTHGSFVPRLRRFVPNPLDDS